MLNNYVILLQCNVDLKQIMVVEGRGNTTQTLAFTHVLVHTHSPSIKASYKKNTATPILGLLSVLSVALQLRSNRLTNLKKTHFQMFNFQLFLTSTALPSVERKNNK